MPELRIEAKERWLEYGVEQTAKLEPKNVVIKILDGEEVVAETDLEALITKFLVVSSEYAQAMALLGMLKEKAAQQGRIVVAGQEEVKQVVAQQMADYKLRQDI
jgi:hypothetical protein